MIFLTLLASLSFAQSSGTAVNFEDGLKIQNVAEGLRELQSGRPVITGIPRFANGICFAENGTDCMTTAPSAASGCSLLGTTQTGAYASGTGTIPFDDSIPQSGEGNEFMTVAVTPTSAVSTLVIGAIAYLGNNNANRLICALFQDTTADALATAFGSVITAADFMAEVNLRHKMTSGTTSATTFKIRCAGSGAGTTTFNGDASAAARKFGGSFTSNLMVWECK